MLWCLFNIGARLAKTPKNSKSTPETVTLVGRIRVGGVCACHASDLESLLADNKASNCVQDRTVLNGPQLVRNAFGKLKTSPASPQCLFHPFLLYPEL